MNPHQRPHFRVGDRTPPYHPFFFPLLKHRRYPLAMTIAAGFRCANGIIIGADTEVGEGNVKRHENKLFSIPEIPLEAGYGIVLTGAGDFSAISHCAQMMREMDFSKCDGSLRGLTGQIRGFITSEGYRELIQRQMWPSGDVATQFIIALRSHDHQTELFRLIGLELYPVQRFVAVGSGAETALFISDWLYRQSMTIQEFVPLALHVFRAAKGQNVGVGGDTKISRLYNAGHGSEDPMHTVWSDAEFLWGLHDLMADVVSSFVESASEDDFEKALEKFIKKAREVKASFVAEQKSSELISSIRQHLQSTRGDPSHQPPSPESPESSDES